MKTLTVAFLAALLSVNGWIAYGQDAARTKLAEQLLDEMNMKGTVEQTFAMVKKMIPAQMEQAKKAMPMGDQDEATTKKRQQRFDKMTDKMMDIVAKEMSWEAMKDDYVAVYAETFTEEELKGLIEFYKSPAGRAFAKKQPELMERSMKLGQKRMLQVMPKIQALTMEAAKEAAKERMKTAAPPEKSAPQSPISNP